MCEENEEYHGLGHLKMSTSNSTHSKTPDNPAEANLRHKLELQTKRCENIWLMLQEL